MCIVLLLILALMEKSKRIIKYIKILNKTLLNIDNNNNKNRKSV
jgi:hypothetical protein